MRQLHLHLISQDFDSKHLKNKKHWNSFNTPFFRDSVDVLQEVSKHGKAIIRDDDSFRSMELRCHRCRSAHPNIPRLKTHISSCQAPFPGVMLDNGKLVFAPGKIRQLLDHSNHCFVIGSYVYWLCCMYDVWLLERNGGKLLKLQKENKNKLVLPRGR